MSSCEILKKINKYHESEPPAFGLPPDLEPEEYVEIYFLLSQKYPNYADVYRRKMNAARANIDRR